MIAIIAGTAVGSAALAAVAVLATLWMMKRRSRIRANPAAAGAADDKGAAAAPVRIGEVHGIMATIVRVGEVHSKEVTGDATQPPAAAGVSSQDATVRVGEVYQQIEPLLPTKV
jgi:hypothetical protein